MYIVFLLNDIFMRFFLLNYLSRVPTSRYEVLKLKETLNQMLKQVGALDENDDPKGATQV